MYTKLLNYIKSNDLTKEELTILLLQLASKYDKLDNTYNNDVDSNYYSDSTEFEMEPIEF